MELFKLVYINSQFTDSIVLAINCEEVLTTYLEIEGDGKASIKEVSILNDEANFY